MDTPEVWIGEENTPEKESTATKKVLVKDSFPKKPSKIFVGSSTDMWGDWVPSEFIYMVLEVAGSHPEHIFQFLTKNPSRYYKFRPLRNAWYGTTVDGTMKTAFNHAALVMSVDIPKERRFVSFEPLLRPVMLGTFSYGIGWIIIGADSRRGAKKPRNEWASSLIEQARKLNIPVWVKDNYKYHSRIKEFPGDCKCH